MIVSNWFEADDMALAWIQHDVYDDAIKVLVQCLERRVDDLAPELTPFLPINRFDHRDVQWLHDILAARFRLTWLREHKTTIKQAMLFGGDEVVNAREFAFVWYDILPQKLSELIEEYPNTVRYVLISVLWPNPDKRGIGAESAFFREVIEPERKRLNSEPPWAVPDPAGQ